jgi:DNA-directed RNA polymerase specialized sigma24 family protein
MTERDLDRVRLDTMLAAFVGAGEREADALLGELLVQEVEPIIDRVLRLHSAGEWDRPGDQGANGMAAADLRQEALVCVIRRLRTLRTDPRGLSIHNFGGYVAAIASNTWSDHLRRRTPDRERLRRRLWRVLRRDPRFELHRGLADQCLCRLADGARCTPKVTDPEGGGHEAWDPAAAADAMAAILQRSGGSLAFGDLLTLVSAGHRGGSRWAGLRRPVEELPDPRPSGAAELVSRAAVETLWQEVQLLPSRQRAALLLGLRESPGAGSALLLFPLTGTATVRQLAAALDLGAERLAELWRELPLDDRAIGELLGVTRQQVINLRKSGRERLARRMRKLGFEL